MPPGVLSAEHPEALQRFGNHKGLPCVCVMGLGFVGLAMATVVATSLNADGQPLFRVIGLDLPQQAERLDQINQGQLPFAAEDPSFAPALAQAVTVQGNLMATCQPEALGLADIIVLDIHLNVHKQPDQQPPYQLEDGPFKAAIREIGARMQPETLLLVETTVPPGFCEKIIAPLLAEAFAQRGLSAQPLLAHAYERVMPGRDYLQSIRAYFRTFAGQSPAAAARARAFLNQIIDTGQAPLYEAPSTTASELAKVMENAYRSVNIALIYEWCLLAEKMGVNLFEVVQSIRVRKTHQNIMNPGFGVGGYCLTKDSLLAQWSADQLYDAEHGLPLSLQALAINDAMPLHTLHRIEAESPPAGKRVAVLGVSYREDVGDTRFSPAETLVRALLPQVSSLAVHDPYLSHWPELPNMPFLADLSALPQMDLIVLTTRHRQYLAQDWLPLARAGQCWVDANNLLNDEQISALLAAGCEVIGIGKGQIARLKNSLKSEAL